MRQIVLITAVWCPSCLIMRPRYQDYVKRHPGWQFTEIDFDESPNIVKQYGVGKTLPAAIVVSEGKELARVVGEQSVKELEKNLDGYE